MRREQGFAHGAPERRHSRVNGQSRDVEQHLPRKRVPVGVEPGRRETDEDVTRNNPAAVDDPISRDDANDEPGQVVLAIGVESRHLRGLAAEQRATVLAAGRRQAFDDLHGNGGIQTSGGEIIQKEQRLRTLHQDVVDAVVDQVDADRAVHARHEGDPELRPDAVRAGHEHGIGNPRALEPKQAAKGSDVGQDAWREGAAGQRSDAAHDLVAGLDVDACLLVVHQKSSV